MLAEEFSTHGYQTQCVGKMHVHPVRKHCGFQGLRLHDGYLGYYRDASIPHFQHQTVTDDYLYDLKNALGSHADFNASGPECNSWVTHPWIYEERLHPTNWVTEESIRFLETRDRTRPFFLMSSYVRPHQPFDAPASYFDLYKDKELRAPACGDWDDTASTEQFGYRKDSIYGCNDAEQQHNAMAGYYACITHVDHQIGRLLSALMESGEYDNTVILFLSDHGELLFDHHLYRKVFAYEGSTHIPLLFHVGKNCMPFQTDSQQYDHRTARYPSNTPRFCRYPGSRGCGRLLSDARDCRKAERRAKQPRVSARRTQLPLRSVQSFYRDGD